jgi:hypothetical protein
MNNYVRVIMVVAMVGWGAGWGAGCASGSGYFTNPLPASVNHSSYLQTMQLYTELGGCYLRVFYKDGQASRFRMADEICQRATLAETLQRTIEQQQIQQQRPVPPPPPAEPPAAEVTPESKSTPKSGNTSPGGPR